MNKVLTLALIFASAVFARSAQVKVEWDPSESPEVTRYNVFWTKVGGTNSMASTTTTSMVIGNLEYSTKYFFFVTAQSDLGLESVPSNMVTIVTETVPLEINPAPVPTALRVLRVVYNTMSLFDTSLNWTCASSSNLIGFKLRYWHAGGTNEVRTTSKTVNLTGLFNGTNYQWAVASVDPFANERWSVTNGLRHSVTNSGLKPRFQTWTTVQEIP